LSVPGFPLPHYHSDSQIREQEKKEYAQLKKDHPRIVDDIEMLPAYRWSNA
jgi:hypothetical protein